MTLNDSIKHVICVLGVELSLRIEKNYVCWKNLMLLRPNVKEWRIIKKKQPNK